MEDDDPVAVDGMLYYLYTLDYPTEVYQKLLCGTEIGSGSDSGIEDEDAAAQDAQIYWEFDLWMYTIGDKYGLKELKETAQRTLLQKADLAGEDRELWKTMDAFVLLIEDLFNTEEISDHLREVRTQFLGLTCEVITMYVRDQRISALIADVPDFAVELVEVLGKKRDERRKIQQEDDKKQEAVRMRLSHIPMNDDSDDDD